jgi:pyruvate formate lyase activating enzyme
MNVLSLIDFAFIDIKHMNPIAHTKETGVSNELILDNIISLAKNNWSGRLVIRIPLIPGFNDDEENLINTAEFMIKHGLSEINILPFHRLGESKWRQCGLEYPYADTKMQSKETLQSAGKIFTQKGLKCYIGHETIF